VAATAAPVEPSVPAVVEPSFAAAVAPTTGANWTSDDGALAGVERGDDPPSSWGNLFIERAPFEQCVASRPAP
jgi:hypothetical protein